MSRVRDLPAALARGAARVPAASTFTGTPGAGFASRTGATLRNTGRVLTTPEYPFLGRASKTYRRDLDMLGRTLRRGSQIVSVGSLGAAGVGGYNAYRDAPDRLAHSLIPQDAWATLSPEQQMQIRDELRRRVVSPGVRGAASGVLHGIAGATHGTADPVEDFAARYGARLGIPAARYAVHNMQQTHPHRLAVADTISAATPLGALLVAARRMFASPVEPAYGTAAAQTLYEMGADALRPQAARLRQTQDLPAEVLRVMSTPAGRGVGAAAVSRLMRRNAAPAPE